jgi:hypothetical protein
MKNKTITVVVVAAIALALVAGLSSSTLLLRGNGTSTPTSTSRVSSTSTSTLNYETATECDIMVESEVVLRVLNSSTSEPIASEPVHAQFVPPGCPTTDFGTKQTNSTGIVAFRCYECYEAGQFNLTVGDYSKSVVVWEHDQAAACVTLFIPTGEVQVSYSQLLLYSRLGGSSTSRSWETTQTQSSSSTGSPRC